MSGPRGSIFTPVSVALGQSYDYDRSVPVKQTLGIKVKKAFIKLMLQQNASESWNQWRHDVNILAMDLMLVDSKSLIQ